MKKHRNDTEREKLIQKKRDLIKSHEKNQIILIKKLAKIAKLDEPKRMSTTFKRAAKMIVYALSIRQIEIHKQMIQSQPIPNFKKGIEIKLNK